ncbi:hypothetical protein GCK72_001141 [Caenorhabditis remanei]|uniref:Uncharacterized protein n=2 Tax=Caenorhabditis remanei TaxID=31234 RepID=A0A6A5HRR3_CAERE|nr:hypothetical protein GCK72_001141 [Caenorhabditis remanei]KAF1769324.1 hypothetical protein GCK72_001141 [Caenorhabditis remanei]
MKILWESDWQGARIEQSITHLSWIHQPDKPDHGLLGVGTDSGSVGVTLTDFRPTPDDLTRYNFNLRGHHSAIRMVTWNRSQTKLASCDATGIIYVWVRNDDRWSVELVNDRGVKVSDLAWSPCGGSALICYEDNFVLIGSASGQRVWSNSFPATSSVTCGVWAPDSKQLVLGFSTGTIQVLSSQGANITERSFTEDRLNQMAFSPVRGKDKEEEWTLAMLTASNKIIMISAYDQINSLVYRSPFQVIRMQWNFDGTILAVINSNNELVMLDTNCRVIHRERVSVSEKGKALIPAPVIAPRLTAFTWAHQGNVVILAAAGCLTTGRILFGVPSLFEIVTYDLWKMMGSSAKKVDKLPIPLKEMNALRELDHHVIRCRIPRPQELCSYVCSVVDARCYCTIRPLARGSHTYVLCFEHLGGLVPLLLGRQVNRFLPQFQIFLFQSSPCPISLAPGSSAQVEDVNSIVRASNARNSLWRRSKRQLRALMSKHVRPTRPDTRLLQVSSNVWCTRFNISSLSPTLLPSFLGQVIYKTSVLHLQPRQMTIDLAVLKKETGKDLPEVEGGTTHLTSSEQGLTSEERQFFEKILLECLSLRAAINSSNFGKPLATPTPPPPPPACQPSTSKAHESSTQTTPISTRTIESKHDVTSMASSVSTWHEEIETLAFIDGDGAMDNDKTLLVEPALKSGWDAMEMQASKKDAEVIRSHVDKLASIAEQLSKRHGDFNVKRDKASINKMRSQMKTLLRRVNEIEQKVANGDVKTEVRQLLSTLKEMKKALGEGVPKSGRHPESSCKIETMSNKTPFWNEQNQVYQLDFGGRVTQESAKNFQIELDTKQVLQFGRIEGGSYTLDFRYPFSASQAFAVALASITQRLK